MSQFLQGADVSFHHRSYIDNYGTEVTHGEHNIIKRDAAPEAAAESEPNAEKRSPEPIIDLGDSYQAYVLENIRLNVSNLQADVILRTLKSSTGIMARIILRNGAEGE